MSFTDQWCKIRALSLYRGKNGYIANGKRQSHSDLQGICQLVKVCIKRKRGYFSPLRGLRCISININMYSQPEGDSSVVTQFPVKKKTK